MRQVSNDFDNKILITESQQNEQNQSKWAELFLTKLTYSHIILLNIIIMDICAVRRHPIDVSPIYALQIRLIACN